MYTTGNHVEVVTDHKHLVEAYKATWQPKQFMVDRHRTKLLPFSHSVCYEPGKDTLCDYGSRHPPMIDFTPEEVDNWCIEFGDDIYVNRVIEDNLPCAITIDMVRKETAADKELNLLLKCMTRQEDRLVAKQLKQYHGVFSDLWTSDGVILKGCQIIIPKFLRANVIGLAHEGHQHAEKTLNLLRQGSWFPNI